MSMAPTLQSGQVVVLKKRARRLRVGDVVLVYCQGREMVKRVARLDGQRLFVVGDNAAESTDSREFGWLPITAVRGKMLLPRSR